MIIYLRQLSFIENKIVIPINFCRNTKMVQNSVFGTPSAIYPANEATIRPASPTWKSVEKMQRTRRKTQKFN
jgi:hypothetical protein